MINVEAHAALCRMASTIILILLVTFPRFISALFILEVALIFFFISKNKIKMGKVQSSSREDYASDIFRCTPITLACALAPRTYVEVG